MWLSFSCSQSCPCVSPACCLCSNSAVDASDLLIFSNRQLWTAQQDYWTPACSLNCLVILTVCFLRVVCIYVCTRRSENIVCPGLSLSALSPATLLTEPRAKMVFIQPGQSSCLCAPQNLGYSCTHGHACLSVWQLGI